MSHFDVVVCGLGAMGSAALHHVTRRGKRVLGLERYAPAMTAAHPMARLASFDLGISSIHPTSHFSGSRIHCGMSSKNLLGKRSSTPPASRRSGRPTAP